MKNLKNLIKTGLISLPLILGGCRDFSNDFAKYKEKDGLVMKAWVDGMGRHFRIDYGTNELYGSYIYALDRIDSPDSTDGRFDEIKLYGVPKGDKLEKYANLDSITKLYNEVKETGRDKK